MSFSPEQFDHIKRSYTSPTYFIETFVGKLTPLEKGLLDDLEHGERIRHIVLKRDVSNKVTLMYVMWRALFVLDTTHVIMSDSLFARTMLWVDLMMMLESLPDWIIEHLEIDTDEINSVRINSSSRIYIAPTESNYIRGQAITTLVVQDLKEVHDVDERRALEHYAHIFAPTSRLMRAFFTNSSSMSIG